MQKSARTRLELLTCLLRLLEKADKLENVLDEALRLLYGSLGIERAAITLVNPCTDKLRIEAAVGLEPEQKRLGAYERGEGITGQVIENGQAVFIANVADEPLFLNRTQSRNLENELISFLCVPIKFSGQAIGALSVDVAPRAGQNPDELLMLLELIAALLTQKAYEQQEKMRHLPSRRPLGFIGNSELMHQVCHQIEIVAPSPTTVLLQGESGTGKELAARAIHAASPMASGPFVSLNCAALPEGLIESELFGHERGAFTGATQTRKGRFEMANGGTLFLDEIGELSHTIQAKLLRVLQERTFERVGGMHSLHTSARLITATNRDLAAMVEEGGFRRDLFYRLNVFPITLPPLRERLEDIPALAAYFLELFAQSANRRVPRLSFSALDLLQAYDWPGNIRELQNVIERALLLTGHDNVIGPEHLPVPLTQERINLRQDETDSQGSPGLRKNLADLEKSCIVRALDESRGNIRQAARKLGLTERVMGLRMKKFALDYKSFRANFHTGQN